jgi:hypothetical protein
MSWRGGVRTPLLPRQLIALSATHSSQRHAWPCPLALHRQQQWEYQRAQQAAREAQARAQEAAFRAALPSETAFLTSSNFRSYVFYGSRPWLVMARPSAQCLETVDVFCQRVQPCRAQLASGFPSPDGRQSVDAAATLLACRLAALRCPRGQKLGRAACLVSRRCTARAAPRAGTSRPRGRRCGGRRAGHPQTRVKTARKPALAGCTCATKRT